MTDQTIDLRGQNTMLRTEVTDLKIELVQTRYSFSIVEDELRAELADMTEQRDRALFDRDTARAQVTP